MSREQVSINELLLSLDSSELQEAEQVRAAVNQQLSSGESTGLSPPVRLPVCLLLYLSTCSPDTCLCLLLCLCLSFSTCLFSTHLSLFMSTCLSLSIFTCPSPYVCPSFSSCLSPSYLSPQASICLFPPFCLHLYVHFFAPACLLPFSSCIVGSPVGPVDGPIVTVVCPVRQRRCCPLLSGGALPGVVVPPGCVPAVLHQGASSQGQVTRPHLLAAAHSHTRPSGRITAFLSLVHPTRPCWRSSMSLCADRGPDWRL